MQPTSSQVHYNAPMTAFSVAILQDTDQFVTHRIFPTLPVDKQSDIFYVYPRGAFLRAQMRERAPGTGFARAGYAIETAGPYYCRNWGLEDVIPDEQRANQDLALNADQDSTTFLTHQGLLRREQSWVDAYFQPSVWTFNKAGVASNPSGSQFLKWSDANSNPIKDVKDARSDMKESTGFKPNVLVLQEKVWDSISEHPDLLDRVKFSGGVSNATPAKISVQAAAALFEVDRIEVLGAIQNTAKEGDADSISFIAGKHASLFYVPKQVGLRTPTPGLTFTWRGLLGNDPMGISISSYREDPIKSDINRIEMAFAQHLVAADLGAFFQDVI